MVTAESILSQKSGSAHAGPARPAKTALVFIVHGIKFSLRTISKLN